MECISRLITRDHIVKSVLVRHIPKHPESRCSRCLEVNMYPKVQRLFPVAIHRFDFDGPTKWWLPKVMLVCWLHSHELVGFMNVGVLNQLSYQNTKYNPPLPFGNQTWLAGKSTINGWYGCFNRTITDFYGPFSSTPCLITRWYIRFMNHHLLSRIYLYKHGESMVDLRRGEVLVPLKIPLEDLKELALYCAAGDRWKVWESDGKWRRQRGDSGEFQ